METLRCKIQHQSKLLIAEFNHGGNWLNTDTEQNNAEKPIKYEIGLEWDFSFERSYKQHNILYVILPKHFLVHKGSSDVWDAELAGPQEKSSHFGLDVVKVQSSDLSWNPSDKPDFNL